MIAVDNSTLTLCSTSQAAQAAGITYRMLDHWCRGGAITPTVDVTGSGKKRGWSPGDVARLEAIGAVVRDLAVLELDSSMVLIARLWAELGELGAAYVDAGTVTVAVAVAA